MSRGKVFAQHSWDSTLFLRSHCASYFSGRTASWTPSMARLVNLLLAMKKLRRMSQQIRRLRKRTTGQASAMCCDPCRAKVVPSMSEIFGFFFGKGDAKTMGLGRSLVGFGLYNTNQHEYHSNTTSSRHMLISIRDKTYLCTRLGGICQACIRFGTDSCDLLPIVQSQTTLKAISDDVIHRLRCRALNGLGNVSDYLHSDKGDNFAL